MRWESYAYGGGEGLGREKRSIRSEFVVPKIIAANNLVDLRGKPLR